MKKIRTTTEAPPDDYYYNYEYWAYDYDGPLTIDVELFDSIIETSITVDTGASLVGFLVNIAHLVVLTRKELRTNFIYIIMIGICVCDLLMLTVALIGDVLESNWLYQIEYDCEGGRPFLHQYFAWIGNAVRGASRRCSGWLALLMALFRALAVMFPMSAGVQKLMKPSSAVWTILTSSLLSAAWDGSCFDTPQNFTYDRYRYGFPAEIAYIQEFYTSADGFSKVFASICYPILTVLLVRELRIARKRSESIRRQEKSAGDPTKMIILLAVSFFLSEFPYGLTFLISNYFWIRNHDIQYVTASCVIMIFTIITINSTIHCLICLFMSSVYRETARRVFWKKSIESMSHDKTTSSGVRNSRDKTT